MRLRFPPLTKSDEKRVAAALPELAAVTNPLDYHNFSWGDEAALTAIYAAVMTACYHLTLLVLDFPRRDRCSEASFEATVNALIAASRRTGAKAAVVSTLQETLPEHRAQQLAEAGIAPLLGLDDAMAAVAAAAECGELLHGPSAPIGWAAQPASRGGRSLSEWEAKRRLGACGLQVPTGPVDRCPNGKPSAASGPADCRFRRGTLRPPWRRPSKRAIKIGFPVALKSVGPEIAHKTEMGAVRLRLRDAAAVRAAATELAHIGEALLVEQMATDPIAELIVGFNRDAIFGWHLVIGSGGVLVNLVGDTCILMAPASRSEIVTAIRGLKVGGNSRRLSRSTSRRYRRGGRMRSQHPRFRLQGTAAAT